MEYRYLGRSGLKVSTLTMGTMTFGGSEKVGRTEQADATRQIDLCLDAGINLLDTANVYNAGVSEEVMKSIVGQIPVGRLGEADEVARCVTFLAADEAGWITGSTLTINGGQFMD